MDRPHYKLMTDGRFELASRMPAGAITALLEQPDGFGSGAPSGSYGGVPGPHQMRGYLSRPRDAAGDTLRRLPLERGESRHLVRTNPLAAGAIATNVDRVVGTGLALVAQPDRTVLKWSDQQAADWQAHVQREFSMWSDSPDCDIRRELNFYDAQRLVERASLESGDVFTILPDGAPTATMPYKLRLQLIEADRCGNPDGTVDSATVAGGVRRAMETGEAEAFHIYDAHPGSTLRPNGQPYAGKWIDRQGSSGRRRILHHFRALRPEMPRGVPYLSPITGLLDQLARYTNAEVVAAIESANVTMIIQTPASTGVAPVFGLTEQQAAASPEIAMAPGAVIGLAPGEEVQMHNPLRPNAGYEPFVLSIIKQIGVALGIPFELLIKMFNASYSASKAALLDAWMRFRAERVWLTRSFCQPVYETWLVEAVILGRIKAPGFFRDPLVRWAYSQAAWFGDSQGSINPKDEVAAYLAAIDGRLTTRERASWELFGEDWNVKVSRMEAEHKQLDGAGILPVPKAGAAAPPEPHSAANAQRLEAQDASTQALIASVAAMAARETPAPQVHINIAPAQVTVEQGDTTIHLPESQINVEAVIEQPAITVHPAAVRVDGANVHVDMPQPLVHVMPAAPVTTLQTFTRDVDGEIASILNTPIAANAAINPKEAPQ